MLSSCVGCFSTNYSTMLKRTTSLVTYSADGSYPFFLFFSIFKSFYVFDYNKIFVVFQLCAMMWAASIGLMQLIFLPKLPIDPNHYGKPTWEIFLVLCSAVFLAIFTISFVHFLAFYFFYIFDEYQIAALYYSTLSIPRDRLKSHYRFGNMPVREFLNLSMYLSFVIPSPPPSLLPPPPFFFLSYSF